MDFFNDFGYPMYALPRYNWNIVESGVKHQNPIYAFIFLVPKIFLLCFIQYITMSVPDDDYSRKTSCTLNKIYIPFYHGSISIEFWNCFDSVVFCFF